MSHATASPPTQSRYDIQRQRRDPTELIAAATKIWLTKPSVFIVAALVVILPIEIVFTGILGEGFSDPEGTPTQTWGIVDQLAVAWFGLSLITAAHARAVVALSAGEKVNTFSALRLGGGAFWTVLGAAIIYALVTIVGFVALIIPGIWVSVAGMFSAQVAALTRTGPISSFKSSVFLVSKAGWWRSFGYSMLVALLGFLGVLLVSVIPVALGDASGEASVAGPLYVIGLAIATALLYSWTALVTTLLYFSWRAKVGDPWAVSSSEQTPDLDAGPDWDPAKSPALGHRA